MAKKKGKNESDGDESLFDLSSQILSRTPALITVEYKDKFGNDSDITLYQSMPGIGLIVKGVFAEPGKKRADDVWINNRGIRRIVLCGLSMQDINKFKLVEIGPDNFEGITITKITEADLNVFITDNIASYYSSLSSGSSRVEFPDYTKLPDNDDASVYGAMKGKDYLKYASFFDADTMYVWDHTEKKVVDVQGGNAIEYFSSVRDNVGIYETHRLYMEWLNSRVSKSVAEIAKEVNKAYVSKPPKGSSYRLPDVINLVVDGREGEEITRNTNDRIYMEFIEQVNKDDVAPPGLVPTKSDVRTWLFYRDFWASNAMKMISDNYVSTVKSDHDGKNAKKEFDKTGKRPDWLWTRNVVDKIGHLIENVSVLKHTELLTFCELWFNTAMTFRDNILSD